MTPLWQAYQAETKEDAADEMASALIELKFADKNALPFLIGRLDPKKNQVWYHDVRLLRHLTGKAYGPESKWSNDKTREAELIKWRQWWEGESAKNSRKDCRRSRIEALRRAYGFMAFKETTTDAMSAASARTGNSTSLFYSLDGKPEAQGKVSLNTTLNLALDRE
jgi:hypothetical protein